MHRAASASASIFSASGARPERFIPERRRTARCFRRAFAQRGLQRRPQGADGIDLRSGTQTDDEHRSWSAGTHHSDLNRYGQEYSIPPLFVWCLYTHAPRDQDRRGAGLHDILVLAGLLGNHKNFATPLRAGRAKRVLGPPHPAPLSREKFAVMPPVCPGRSDDRSDGWSCLRDRFHWQIGSCKLTVNGVL